MTNETDNKPETLSAWLARELSQQGLSIRAAENRIGVPRATLNGILRGKFLNRDISTLVALAEGLEVEPTSIFVLAINEWRDGRTS